MNTAYAKILTAGSLVISALLPGVTQAQCASGGGNPSVPLSTPSGDFVATSDGTVLHKPSGLVWQRCVLGETWNGSSCDGSPQQLSWAEALAAADGHVQDGEEDWRLPNRIELGAIVEDRCELPAINDTIFPGAPGGSHWSSSPFASGTDEAWIVDFDSGGVVPATTETLLPVRLVRGGRSITP